MERLLNLTTMSKPTQKKIRDAVGVKNVLQLIKLAKDNDIIIKQLQILCIITIKEIGNIHFFKKFRYFNYLLKI